MKRSVRRKGESGKALLEEKVRRLETQLQTAMAQNARMMRDIWHLKTCLDAEMRRDTQLRCLAKRVDPTILLEELENLATK
ncbi:MAG: hypothetical protein JOZ88_11330, partial [Hyphomicrobiales bacterium]|nr:hypothetical protein [Hyphomicrobiales bacterium]